MAAPGEIAVLAMTAPETLATVLWWLLGAVLLPVWLLSGLADYVLHARTDIAHTSGTRESVLHLLQTAQVGIPLLALLFLEVNAGTLLLMAAGVVAHTVTSWRDLRVAIAYRHIPPAEQYVHSFLNVLPWVALSLVVALHWPVARALFDPAIPSDWLPRLREPGFDPLIVVAVLVASALLGVLPGLVELARTLAARSAADQASSNSARSATNPR